MFLFGLSIPVTGSDIRGRAAIGKSSSIRRMMHEFGIRAFSGGFSPGAFGFVRVVMHDDPLADVLAKIAGMGVLRKSICRSVDGKFDLETIAGHHGGFDGVCSGDDAHGCCGAGFYLLFSEEVVGDRG